jgi:iron complex transport system substrate-binding protein
MRRAARLERSPGLWDGWAYLTDGNRFFHRPGARLAESLEILAEILHPDGLRFGHEGVGWRCFPPPIAG